MGSFCFIMSWRIIYIENSDYLSSYLDSVKIKNGNDETTIPFSDINSIIVDNRKTNLSVGFLNKCVEYKINLVICDYYHLPSSMLIPYSGNYQTSEIQYKQLKWPKESKSYLWKEIIRTKINGQIKVLTLCNKSNSVIDVLKAYVEDIELNDATNREGLAAKMYFRELFGKQFIRHNDDIFNSCLDYGYAIIRSQICRSLVARGLNLHIGIFHKGITNDFNLADDFMEIYRPIIDLWVNKNINRDTVFNSEIRKEIIRIPTYKVKYEKNVTIINAINTMVDKVLNYFNTGDISLLVFPDIEYHE